MEDSSSGKRSFAEPENVSSLFKKPKSTTITKYDPKIGTTSNDSTFVTMEETTNRRRGMNFKSMDAYTRHKILVNYYVLTHPSKVQETFSRDRSRDKSEFSVLLENHRFIWSDEELNSPQLTWGQRVAKKYYDKLFKEYCIIDLSRYKENKFGMRWRSEPEVMEGKGQFICGAKRCSVRGGLTSWEVLFSYMEAGEKKSALIKVRLCPECSDRLNYHHVHKKAKLKERKSKKTKADKSDSQSKPSSSSSSKSNNPFVPGPFVIKEEIVTDAEDEHEHESRGKDNTTEDSNYQDLIDQIWKQPVKLEPEETETTLEDEVDDYLTQLFM